MTMQLICTRWERNNGAEKGFGLENFKMAGLPKVSFLKPGLSDLCSFIHWDEYCVGTQNNLGLGANWALPHTDLTHDVMDPTTSVSTDL